MKLTKEEIERILEWYDLAFVDEVAWEPKASKKDIPLMEKLDKFITEGEIKCILCGSPKDDHKKRHRFKEDGK